MRYDSRMVAFLLRGGVCTGALIVLAACGTQPGPAPPMRLVERYAPGRIDGLGPTRTLAFDSARTAELVVDEEGAWIKASIRKADWKSTVRDNVWVTSLPVRGIGDPGSTEPASRLLVDGEELGEVHFAPTSVGLRLGEGEEPPEEASVICSANPWRETGEGSFRIVGHRFSGEGFVVWPGQSVELEVDLDSESVLRFATAAEQAFPLAESGRPVTFRVLLDGAPILEEEQAVPKAGSYAWHEVRLAPARGATGRITFEVTGPFAYTSILVPTLQPAEVEADPRPDIVVFLADTFRADNIAAYGSTRGLTPNIDRFAEEGFVFRRAWSTATSTLPAHVSLFTGFFPRQCGIRALNRKLPDSVETIAEVLTRHGYRTGAITDSVVVSQAFGLDRGFEWFDEDRGSLDSTLQRAADFLDADDDRPTFLFVQTYRVHSPYELSAAVLEDHGQELGIRDTSYAQALEALQSLVDQTKNFDETASGVPAALEKMRGLYLAGTADLDRGFGEFLDDLEQRGGKDNTVVIFASDHGEGLGEHGQLFHTGKVFEEQIRIPLILSGKGIETGSTDHAASLVDLAPTIARLAGVPVDRRLPGSSLLTLNEDRPMFAFQCRWKTELSSVCVVDGPRKLISLETLSSWTAFDLIRDPDENADLAGSEAGWPGEMAGRYGPLMETFLVPLFGAEAATLDLEQLEVLDEMGYGGE